MSGQVIALKEWASAIEALRNGQQILIMRKGGIREETRDFQVESESFYLYPTYEHQRRELLKEEYQYQLDETLRSWSSQDREAVIRCYAELTEDILIASQEELDRLKGEHIWTDRFAEERVKWKRAQPLHLMLLRVYELTEPVRVSILPEYNGCKSWIGLPAAALDAAERRPVLSDEEYAERINTIKSLLR
jgi:hypothetical protein